MEQFNLADNTKLIVKDNVLAVFCDSALKTVSSAFYNGGSKQVKAVLNVGVPEGYNDRSLHLDPLELITSSAAKLGFNKRLSCNGYSRKNPKLQPRNQES